MTQNIDGLHAAAGTRELIEVHGSIAHSSCLECLRRYELEDVRARLAADPDGVPRCDCGHALKPDVVLFGEFLPGGGDGPRVGARRARADVLLCVGSSLEVYPVAGLPPITLGAGGAVAIVTKGATPYDDRRRRAAVGRRRGRARGGGRRARCPAALDDGVTPSSTLPRQATNTN